MQEADHRTHSDHEFGILATVTFRSENLTEAHRTINTTDWITDLSGWSAKIIPISSAIRSGNIHRIECVGVIPHVLGAGEDLTQQFPRFRAACWLFGTAVSKEAFLMYINSGFWLATDQLEVAGISKVYDGHQLEHLLT